MKDKKISQLVSLSILLFIFLFATSVNAAIYYVDQNHPQGSDSNPGTEDLPWKTINKACSTLVAGDTVLIKTGRYASHTTDWEYAFNPAHSGTSDEPITFKSWPKGAAILDGVPAMRPNGRQYIVIDGFTVEGNIGFQNCSYCTIKNCEVTKGGPGDAIPPSTSDLQWGIFLHTSHHCTIENNYVHNMEVGASAGSNNGACIQLFLSRDSVIQHNVADAGGIIYSAFGQKAGQVYRNIWRYNIALNAASAGYLGMAATAENYASEDNIYYQNIAVNCESAFKMHHMCYRFKIYNNVAYHCNNFLNAYQTTEDFQVWNNIFVGTGNGFAIGGEEANPAEMVSYSDYNNFYRYSPFSTYRWTTWISSLTGWQNQASRDGHSIESDPLFVDPGANDFHLQSSSPCLGTGKDGVNMGCYITEAEVIGLIPNPLDPANPNNDHDPPSPPTGLQLEVTDQQ